MNPFLVGGDWNAHPANTRKHRPGWIARVADLTAIHGGKGPFGNIDFGLTDALEARTLGRGRKYGSDHGVVVWETLNGNGETVRGGTWNVHADGRDPDLVAAAVDDIMRHFRLDYLLLQETTHRVRQATINLGYTVVGEDVEPAAGANCIAVAGGIPVFDPRPHKLSTLGWPVTRRRWHSPCWAWSARVRGIRLMSVHLPNFERSPFHLLAYAQAARRITRRVQRRHKLANRRR